MNKFWPKKRFFFQFSYLFPIFCSFCSYFHFFLHKTSSSWLGFCFMQEKLKIWAKRTKYWEKIENWNKKIFSYGLKKFFFWKYPIGHMSPETEKCGILIGLNTYFLIFHVSGTFFVLFWKPTNQKLKKKNKGYARACGH